MSETYVPAELRRRVRQRAREACEYCLLPEWASFASHEIDHIIAEKHGGATGDENLALCCAVCNKRKGSDLASIDPVTGQIERLFHPRRDQWLDHFRMRDGTIDALTSVGRVTIRLLQFNLPERIVERRLLVEADWSPPGTTPFGPEKSNGQE